MYKQSDDLKPGKNTHNKTFSRALERKDVRVRKIKKLTRLKHNTETDLHLEHIKSPYSETYLLIL